jgi:Short-chain dehydrogenases of various substrate specificities
MDFLNIENIQVDVLINNAGFGHDEPFLETDFDLVLDLFKVNVLGLMYLTQKIAMNMLDQPKGQIINIASLAGKVSTPNYATYGATKGAVISFSNALRMELKAVNIQVPL